MSIRPPLMGRRQFLVASSACAVATAALGPKVFADPGPPPRKLAVGFARLDETTVRSAQSITAGDGSFISRGARISVSGASGAPADPKDRRTVELLTHYSYMDGAERKVAPFRAWACSRTTGCEGNRVNFTVPVDETQKIAFGVALEKGRQPALPTSRRRAIGSTAPVMEELPLVLSLLSGDSLKLVRGFYVIVPLFDGDHEPGWSAYELGQIGGRWALADRDGNVAPFEHFILRIDYAS